MMQGVRICRDRHRDRSGFTLLELILAVGLMAVLMAAIHRAMSAYWILAADSHEDIVRSQVTLSVFRLLSGDLRSCCFRRSYSEGGRASGHRDSDPDSGAEQTGSGGEFPEKELSGIRNGGLIGTERDLLLCVSYPDRDLNYVPASEAAGGDQREGDLMIVRWILADSAAGGLSETIAERLSSAGQEAVIGLARISGGLVGLGQAVSRGDVQRQAGCAKLIAAEVQDVRFEYFDGVQWLGAWDSRQSGRLPTAVRIRMTLRDPAVNSVRRDHRDPPLSTHQLTVFLSAADRYSEGAEG